MEVPYLVPASQEVPVDKNRTVTLDMKMFLVKNNLYWMLVYSELALSTNQV